MDAQIIINSIDQTGYLLSISRSYNYCSVSQEFSIDLDISCPTTIDTYDTVVIYEEGVKVLTGFVSSINKSAPQARITVKGQDTFVKATDFFVPEIYTTGFGETAQYWLTFLLNLAGLTAIFTDGAGPFIIAEQEIGLSSVSELVTPILQYAGFYARVNEEGVIIIGKINKTPITPSIIEGVNILSDGIEKSYDKTRNKALVFGGVDTTLNRFEHIISIAERDLDFLPVDQTAVVGNPYIADQDSADDFANALVNEFAKPTQIKSIKVLANPVWQAGKFIEVYSDIFTGTALITSMQSRFDESGYIMDLILDDPCPRVVGAIKHQPELYAGTAGNGVWAYEMYSGVWQDISAGLTNLYINDLSVDNGLFIAATPAGVFTKLASANWVYQTLPLYSGSDGTLVYSGVYANLFDLQVNAIVTSVRPDYNYSWLYTGTIASGGSGFVWSGAPISYGTVYSGEYYTATDIEGNYSTKYVTTRWQVDNTTEKIFFTLDNGIKSMGAGGEDSASVIPASGSMTADDVAISTDMSRIAFAVILGGGAPHIYTSKLDGTDSRQLTTGGFGDYNPSWSPDDSKIVYVKDGISGSQIYFMNSDGTGQQIIPGISLGTYEYPRFIDENTIVYGKIVGSFFQIFSIDINGANETQLTNNLYDTRISTYSSARLKVLYTADIGVGNVDAWSINTTGGSPTLEFSDFADMSSINLTDDGKFVIYSSGGKIYIAGTANRHQLALTTGDDVADGSNVFAVIGTEDNDIAFYKSDGFNIKQVNVDGTNNVVFFNSGTDLINRVSRSTSKTYFAFDIHSGSPGIGTLVAVYVSDGTTATNIPHSLDFFNGSFNNAGNWFSVNPVAPKVAVWKAKEDASVGNHKWDVYEIGSGAAGQLTNNEHMFSGDSRPTIEYSPNGSSIAYGVAGNPNKVFVNGSLLFDGIFRGWGPDDNTILYAKDNALHSLPPDIYEWNLTDSTERYMGGIGSFTQISPNYKWFITDLGYLTPYNNPGIETLFDSDVTQAIWTSDSESIVYKGSEIDDDLYVTSMRIELASGTKPFHRGGMAGAKTRVFQTFDNQAFFLVFEDEKVLLENNVDTYSPLTVYGRDGNFYATDFITYSGTIASGLITYDIAARTINTETELYATTTQGIYRTIVSGVPSLKNSVAAREIVTRYYGSGEIFFSVAGEVKQSITQCSTYVDISSGLPGSLVTVLRLDR